MAPQFVDFDADGRTDIVTATFDGSPHVALAGKEGFAEPTRIHDANGNRVMLQQFWNYETEKWDKNADQPEGHCTSAVAFDWDNDGDLDLLLGSYGDGNLYRQMNEGKPGAPKFTGVNIPVTAGGEPLGVPGGITTPRLVDWDADGRTDLLVGGYGDSYGLDKGGGVWLYRNVGKLGAPAFAAPITLVERSPKNGTDGPTRPDAGLYPDAVDYDGDGDLDLIVGGYSMWQPKPRELTEEEQARVAVLREAIDAGEQALGKMYETIEGENLSEEESETRFAKLQESAEFQSLMERLQAARQELAELVPPPSREAFVWLYRRTSAPGQ